MSVSRPIWMTAVSVSSKPEGPAALLLALQHGDSFFPSGAVAFSMGLETLLHDAQVRDAAELGRFLEGQLGERWATADRAFLAAAHEAGTDLDALAAVDWLQDAMTLPRELREGSRRAGAAVLSVHAKLQTPQAAAYRALVRGGDAPGHLATVQGLVLRGVGLTLDQALAVSAHGLAVALLAAALRLGLIGHLDGQRLLGAARAWIVAALRTPLPAPEQAHSYTPLADVAIMRHESQDERLFAN